VDRLLASPSVRALDSEASAVDNPVFDAQIVASCRESGATPMLTEDRDFARILRFKTEPL
jgi:predicted nucleic acid-binding protein